MRHFLGIFRHYDTHLLHCFLNLCQRVSKSKKVVKLTFHCFLKKTETEEEKENIWNKFGSLLVLKVLIESCISLHSIFFSEIHLSWSDVIHFPQPLECKQCGIPACQNVYLVSVTTRKKAKKISAFFLLILKAKNSLFS